MPRPLKPYKVDEVVDRALEVRITIFFDRDRKVFFGEMADTTRFESRDLEEAKRLVREAIPKHHHVTWEKRISLNVSNTTFGFGSKHSTKQCDLSFSYERFEIAKKPDGSGYLSRPFYDGDPASDPRTKSDIGHHWVHKNFEKSLRDEQHGFEIEYSDAAWQAIIAIVAAVEGAREKLLTLFRRDDLGAHLEQLFRAGLPGTTQLLLPAPPGSQPPDTGAASRPNARRRLRGSRRG